MKIYVADDYKGMSRKAANIVSAHVILKPNSVLGLATGSTPVGMYQQLIDWYNKGDLDFSQVRTVNLDEYVGLAPTHDQSYRYFMQTNLFDHVNIDPASTNVPNGMAADPEAECLRYNQVIRDMGGIDIQVLGMGHNGHIGFNEPGHAFELETHVVDLTESTIEANARFFASREEVPAGLSPWASSPSCRPGRSWWWSPGRAKRTSSRPPSPAPWSPRCPPPSSRCTPTWCWWVIQRP